MEIFQLIRIFEDSVLCPENYLWQFGVAYFFLCTIVKCVSVMYCTNYSKGNGSLTMMPLRCIGSDVLMHSALITGVQVNFYKYIFFQANDVNVTT